MKLAIQFLVFTVFGFASAIGLPQEVSYFRQDHGVAKGNQALPEDFKQGAKQLWRTPLASGHSSPSVCGDTIFITTFHADDKELATVAIDRTTGKIRWKQIVPTKTFEAFHATGSPASSTPACNGSQVFAFFGSYGMLCYDLDGKLLWERKMGPFQDEFGACSSPILVDGKVILNEDHDLNSFILALDQRTGETIWKTPRDEASRSYSSPIILDRNGKKEILIAGSLQLSSYDPATGKKLWWYNGLSRIVDSTPVIQNGIIYIATWTPGGDPGERIAMEPFPEALEKYDKDADKVISKSELPSGSPVIDRFFRIDLNQDGKLEGNEWTRHAAVFERAQNVAVAIEPGTEGELTSRFVKWTHTRGLPTVPSSVVYDGVLTMVKDSGIVTTIDVESGQMIHQGRAEGRGNYYSSLVAGDGKVYMTSESGVMTVFKAGKEWKILSSHDFGERIMATPVMVDGVMFLRTDDALYSFVKS
jgi:outer membrane protein assembly factor BamB